MRRQRHRRRLREHADPRGPRAGGVHDPRRLELARARHDGARAAALDANSLHRGAPATLRAGVHRVAQIAPQELVHVDPSILGEEDAAGDVRGRQHRDEVDALGRREDAHHRSTIGRRGGRRARRAQEWLLAGDENSRGLDQGVLGKVRRRIAKKRGALHLQLLERRHRIPLDDRRRAPAGRVEAGLGFLLEEHDVGHATPGEKVGERRAGDAATDDHDVEALPGRHTRHPSLTGGPVKCAFVDSTAWHH